MTWLFWGFEMSAILLVWQILLVSLSLALFSFPEERRGLVAAASAVCCRDLLSGAADAGLAKLAGI